MKLNEVEKFVKTKSVTANLKQKEIKETGGCKICTFKT